jgi:eukaryotic-like serine/threonine-protein kinase
MSTQTPQPVTVAGKAPHARRRKFIMKLIGAAIGIFLVGYLIAVYLLFPPPAAPEDGIIVPNLAGQSLQGARDRLRPLELEVGDTISLPHTTIPPGIVIAQSPLAGQQLRRGAQVNVGLSSGLPSATVPYVVGMASRRAANLLTRLGFTVTQTIEPSEHPNGTVVRTTPEAGIRQPLPARVLVVVSSGLVSITPPDTVIRTDTVGRDTIR